MGNTEIREPKQKRSIEKKKRIIEAGFSLICEKGYHNTNTAEIAKAAGVSTGIVYNYFADKKDIFIAAVQFYADKLISPMFEKLSNINKPFNLEELIREFIAIFIQSHYISKSAHEEMMAMSHSDKDVGKLFQDFEINTANRLVELMQKHGITPSNPHEKIHIAIGLIEDLCHKIVYNKHPSLNYDVMTDEIVNIVTRMLTS